MKKIISRDDIVLFSDIIIQELNRVGMSKGAMRRLFRMPKPANTRHVHVYTKDGKQARTIARKRGVPLADVLHALLARNNGAQMISRDMGFEKLGDIVSTYCPEDII